MKMLINNDYILTGASYYEMVCMGSAKSEECVQIALKHKHSLHETVGHVIAFKESTMWYCPKCEMQASVCIRIATSAHPTKTRPSAVYGRWHFVM